MESMQLLCKFRSENSRFRPTLKLKILVMLTTRMSQELGKASDRPVV